MKYTTSTHSDKLASQYDSTSQLNDEIDELLFPTLVETENTDLWVQSLDDQSTTVETTLRKIQATWNRAELTGGDLDDDGYQAEVVGEEAVGGQTPTPDQSVTEDLQKAVGISSIDGEPVRTIAKLAWRDHHPWQLRPESAEDYQQRMDLNQPR